MIFFKPTWKVSSLKISNREFLSLAYSQISTTTTPSSVIQYSETDRWSPQAQRVQLHIFRLDGLTALSAPPPPSTTPVWQGNCCLYPRNITPLHRLTEGRYLFSLSLSLSLSLPPSTSAIYTLRRFLNAVNELSKQLPHGNEILQPSEVVSSTCGFIFARTYTLQMTRYVF
ncbi:hypothetical protein J6590_057121 [Homalodisca vitripennis]|nr:hypothetical protein J6590_057121 [Homalodisca vitripennis]